MFPYLTDNCIVAVQNFNVLMKQGTKRGSPKIFPTAHGWTMGEGDEGEGDDTAVKIVFITMPS